jgi:microcystin-dependent protein
MAGSISLSLSQQFDNDGDPLAGGLLYFFQSGTTIPQSAFQDSALTIPHPNPIELDAGGRVPAFYLADGSIKIRLSNASGVTILTSDGLLVIGPSSGGGGGPAVDPTTVLATGDVKSKYGTGTLTGWVRANGRTLGSATSGATEHANADAQALFEYLWTADANLTVSSGRGATANADWLANKTITLPDARGRTLAALDDMGNSAAGRLTATHFGTSAIVLGATGGGESHTLTTAQMPAHDHGGAAASDGAHTHTVTASGNSRHGANGTNTGTNWFGSDGDTTTGGTGTGVVTSASNGAHTHTISSQGSSAAHNNVQPTILVTVYIKL